MFGSFYNTFEDISEDFVMSKTNLKSQTKSDLNSVKISDKLAYSRPKLHYIGSLEKVQGGSSGQYVDASGRYYS